MTGITSAQPAKLRNKGQEPETTYLVGKDKAQLELVRDGLGIPSTEHLRPGQAARGCERGAGSGTSSSRAESGHGRARGDVEDHDVTCLELKKKRKKICRGLMIGELVMAIARPKRAG